MSVLSNDPIQDTALFDALPEATGCIKSRFIPSKHAFDAAEFWEAPGAELVGLHIIIWRCPYSRYPAGYIMQTQRSDKSYNPDWDMSQSEDFFSSFQHFDEIIQRHTFGMLNLERLQNLNKIWKEQQHD